MASKSLTVYLQRPRSRQDQTLGISGGFKNFRGNFLDCLKITEDKSSDNRSSYFRRSAKTQGSKPASQHHFNAKAPELEARVSVPFQCQIAELEARVSVSLQYQDAVLEARISVSL